MPHDELVRALQARDLEKLRGILDAEPSLISDPIPGDLLPDALGRGQVGNTALHVAAFFGGKPVLAELLDRGADPSARNAENRTPVHVALEHNLHAAQALEELGIEKDVIHAACRGDHDRLRALLEADPDLASDCSTGLSVLGWATYYGARESAELLFEYGAGPDDRELRCAAGIANTEMGELLLDHGADLDEVEPCDGSTALHVAVAHPYSCDATDFVRMLLARGADPSIGAGDRGLTALELARERLTAQEKAGIDEGHEQWRNYVGVIAMLEERV